LRLIVADSDTDYARMLARAIRESDWHRKVTVVLAVGREGTDLPAPGTDGDAVLADAAIIKKMVERGDGGTLVCLAEERETAELVLDGRSVPCLFKYQPVHDLMTQLMERVSAPAAGVKSSASACRVIAVYSASGGAGKTTFAAGLADWLAAAGRRVVCLNMERIPGFPGGAPDGSRRFARMLYHLRREEHNALLSLAVRHPEGGYDRFPPTDHAEEWSEYGEEDIRRLLLLLRSSGRWDAVVADCDSSLTEPVKTVIRQADDVFWLETDDETGAFKSAFALRMLESAGGQTGAGNRYVIPVPSPVAGMWPDFAAALRNLGIGEEDGDE